MWLSLLLTANASAASFGVFNEGNAPVDYVALRASGVTHVRFTVYWNRIAATEGEYDWVALDSQINAMHAAGIVIYASVMWAPSHASEGLPTFEMYTDGCTEFDSRSWIYIAIGNGPQPDNGTRSRAGYARQDNYVVPNGGTLRVPAPGVLANDDGSGIKAYLNSKPRSGTATINTDGSFTYQHNGSGSGDAFAYLANGIGGSIHFEWERSYCYDTPRVDSLKLWFFARALASRYGAKVAFWGVWNEPEYGIYWPPRRWYIGEHVGDYDRLLNEVILPFTAGIRSVIPAAVMVGPETGDPGFLRWVLQKEKSSGSRWFDVVSLHAYPWGGRYPESALVKLDTWLLPIISEFGPRRVWLSETSPDTSPNVVDETLAMTSAVMRRKDVEVVVFGRIGDWFNGDNVTPSKFSERFKTLLLTREKQRAVRPR